MWPKKLENLNLEVDYKVSEGDIKWFIMKSVVKLAMSVKKKKLYQTVCQTSGTSMKCNLHTTEGWGVGGSGFPCSSALGTFQCSHPSLVMGFKFQNTLQTRKIRQQLTPEYYVLVFLLFLFTKT